MSVPSLKLSTGYMMPMFGLGTWQSPSSEVRAAVEHAIDVGYRHIDCAWFYQNEDKVGEAIQAKIKENIVKRHDLFIVSKLFFVCRHLFHLWNTHHNPEDVRTALTESLKALKLDYLDLYLIHFPVGFVNNGESFPRDKDGSLLFSNTDYMETWKAMEKLQEEGLVKSIGVSNFNLYQLKRVIKEGKIAPVTNQFELHPYLIEEDLVKFCKENNVIVTGYSPLCMAYRSKMQPDDPVLLEDPMLKQLAGRLNKTVAQVVLRYLIQRGTVVIPKSVTLSRIESNIKIFDFELSDEDMNTISSMDRNFRFLKGKWMSDHKYFPFTENYSE